MKAAVIFTKGGMPEYTDYPEPVAGDDGQLILSVKAAAIKHIDKSQAAGKHYSTKDSIKAARVPGGDGVGILADGTRVYAIGVSGMLAERAAVEEDRMVKLPPNIDDGIAAALPNAVAGSAMALLFRAALKPGDTVLINGATGFTGKIAIQVAKHYGAKRIVATGRNPETLKELQGLGADEIISLNQDDASFVADVKTLQSDRPVDIIIDYLWGHSAELILSALKGKGAFTHKVRFVSVGAVTGDIIQLSAEVLRSVDLQLCGSGLGSWTKEEMKKLFADILPEMFVLAAANKLQVDIVQVKLADIGQLWDMEIPDGKRLVITM